MINSHSVFIWASLPDNMQPLVVHWPNVRSWVGPTLAASVGPTSFCSLATGWPTRVYQPFVTTLGRRLSNLSLQPFIPTSGKRRPNAVMQRWLHVGSTYNVGGLAQRWLPTLARRLFAHWQLVGPLEYTNRWCQRVYNHLFQHWGNVGSTLVTWQAVYTPTTQTLCNGWADVGTTNVVALAQHHLPTLDLRFFADWQLVGTLEYPNRWWQRRTNVCPIIVLNVGPMPAQPEFTSTFTISIPNKTNTKLTQCCYNAGPASQTVGQHYTSIRPPCKQFYVVITSPQRTAFRT